MKTNSPARSPEDISSLIDGMLARAKKEPDSTQPADAEQESPFDFIIVGSGAGGGPLACRLAEAGKKVLLVEAGKDPKQELVDNAQIDLQAKGEKARFLNPEDATAILEAPLFHGASTEDDGLSWQFSVRHYDTDARQTDDHKYDATRDPSSPLHDPNLPGSPPSGSPGKGGIFYPRSAGIGGCTGHHAMIVIRPNDRDWDHISELTNDPSWSAQSMQPYFAKMENCLYLDEYRGVLAKLLGWLFDGFLAIMRIFNPRAALDRGGHGFKGWQPTSFISLELVNRIIKTDRDLTDVLIQSAFKVVKRSNALTAWLRSFLVTLGFARTLDPNDTTARSGDFKGGVFLIPLATGGTQHHEQVVDEAGFSMKGRRSGVREFVLKTQKARPENLIVVSNLHVQQVLFDDNVSPPRAIGIVGLKGEHLYRASPLHGRAAATEVIKYFVKPSGGEVILSGGSFNTPQLLMLSGIGDPQELARHHIPVRAALPGVGRNLQDRYEVGVISELHEEFKSLDTVAFDPASTTDQVLKEWREKKEGLYSSNGGTLAILQRSSLAEGPGPDLFTFGAPAAFRGYYWRWSQELLRPYLHAPNEQRNLWTWVILKAYTRNNGGTVRLRSADPLDTPDICFHSFDEGVPAEESDKDADAIIEAINTMRELNGQKGSPFKDEIQPKNYLAQANAKRRALGQQEWSLRDWIKNEAWGHHACGTCRMGSDPHRESTNDLTDKGAVLDSHFKVHGVSGLRVVDASVFPKIPGYFILAPIFMVSEKAAETILTEQGDSHYPDVVRDLELEALRTRRDRARVDSSNQRMEPETIAYSSPLETASNSTKKATLSASTGLSNLVGLALSGGGVRSATFALGVLQTLAAKNRLRQIDYLSTISGGGFIGSFLGRLFTRDRVKEVADPVGRAQDLLKDNSSGPLRWLRTQGNYLFASGTDDWLVALGVFFRNLFAVHLVIGALVLTLFGTLAGLSTNPWVRKLVPQPPGPADWFGYTPSAWWWLPVALLVLVIVPMTLGYWLAPKVGSYRTHPPFPLLAWLVLVGGAAAALTWQGLGHWAAAALLILGLAWLWQELARRGLSDATITCRRLEGTTVRNRLTRGLGETLVILVVMIGWVALDTVASGIVIKTKGEWLTIVTTVMALSPLLERLRALAERVLIKKEGTTAINTAKVMAVVIAAVLLFFVDLIAHALFNLSDWRWAWGCIGIALLFSLAIGRAFDLLNLTSLHAAYGARLARTYLGASNSARFANASNIAADVGIAHPDDDLPHYRYRPEKNGGPLHLITVCVNETIDHASQREIRTNKGLLMTVSSFGVSVGRRYFAKWSDHIEAPRWLRFRRRLEGVDRLDGQVTPPSLEAIPLNADPNTFHPLGRRDDKPAVVQSLSLADWTAISGAAFSTGLGRNTSPLLALFMGLVNLRLGYWWDSGVLATERPGRFPSNLWRRLKELPGALFRTQELLLSEWRARFDGPSREFWNLSDGGHIEQSGVYELIRRRLPLIICTDAMEDPDYAYGDLATLVRLARVDFGAEIEWLDPVPSLALPALITNWIDVAALSRLTELKGQPAPDTPTRKHAALARIGYSDGSVGYLLVIKASLAGDESLDVMQCGHLHPDFPQDPTSDQTYDDHLWECYRKLGAQAAAAVIK